MVIGLGTDFWGNSLYVWPENMNRIDSEFISQSWKLLPVIFSLSGTILAFVFYTVGNQLLFKLKMSFIGKKLYNFLNKKWFFDKIYNEYINQVLLQFSYRVSYKVIDRGIIEVLGPMGLSRIIYKQAFSINNLQTGYLYHYALLMLISCTGLIFAKQYWALLQDIFDYRLLSVFVVSFLFYFFF